VSVTLAGPVALALIGEPGSPERDAAIDALGPWVPQWRARLAELGVPLPRFGDLAEEFAAVAPVLAEHNATSRQRLPLDEYALLYGAPAWLLEEEAEQARHRVELAAWVEEQRREAAPWFWALLRERGLVTGEQVGVTLDSATATLQDAPGRPISPAGAMIPRGEGRSGQGAAATRASDGFREVADSAVSPPGGGAGQIAITYSPSGMPL
jgi:hypothetical protein